MNISAMTMLGVQVKDLDAAIELYSEMFGVEFEILKPGKDYPVHDALAGQDPDSGRLRTTGRIAIDRTEYFELVETPEGPEGKRNIHFRVDDIDEASRRAEAAGLRMIRDIIAGGVRETVFHPDDLNGVRLCLMQYDGDSFIDALKSGSFESNG